MSSSAVKIVPPEEVGKNTTGQTDGMTRKAALVNVSDKICSSTMLADPHTSSAIHHHGHLDTIVYALRGSGGTLIWGPNPEDKQRLAPGSHALIPAWVEHQEANEGEEQVEWIIVRSGREPVVVNLPKGWGSSKEEGDGKQ
ncbi:hypothetical protein BCV69DRAFT_283476 [Microstroma glucosiphilum]|uniref:Cupin type-2 domain-containing protein n=1 Tax=Pseudomicrostroma glucosiphilum TaxID=1684307 RepID=A0A316U3S9_9BASI|nr:hypothetical protein BCV69DRAFT_283476 [Pseudomicrostroma glucosiphilum]PWN19946.1 hypothetical protein BCV69DRAFT_283476 [Pseudomicrostroma glucosiphilum]